MKLFLDFLPIVLFFVAFKWGKANEADATAYLDAVCAALGMASIPPAQAPIALATVVAVLATVLQIVILKIMRKPIETMQWVGLALIVIFGGMTLFFQNEAFIQWKPTILYWLMAAGFAVAYGFKRNPIEMMMREHISLTPQRWGNLLWAWVVFFVLMGVVNIWVAYTFSTDAWVNFKLFGTLGATLLFIIAQGVYIQKHGTATPKTHESP